MKWYSWFYTCDTIIPLQDTDRPHYDVVVVGAGPAGATLGYFLAKMGRKVLVLEKKKFPRDKICGDALVKRAIEILDEMGVYEQLLKESKLFVVSQLSKSFIMAIRYHS